MGFLCEGIEHPSGSREWWAEVKRRSDEACAREAAEHAATRAALIAAGLVVHRSVGGDRGDQLIACTNDWTEAKYGGSGGLTDHKDVFEAEDDRLFTFSEDLVTCPGCATWRAPTPEGEAR